MPDLKISEMTPAASIDGTEEIPFAKSGANGKMQASQLMSVKDIAQVHRASALSLVSGFQKMIYDAAPVDTNSIYDTGTGKFTPKKAGYYLIHCRFKTNTNGTKLTNVYKNGVEHLRISGESSYVSQIASGLVYCNGTTDYIEIFCSVTSTQAVTVGPEQTYCHVIGPM